MKRLLKIKILLMIGLGLCFGVSNTYAGWGDLYQCYSANYAMVPKAQIMPDDSDEIKEIKTSFEKLKKELKAICDEADDKFTHLGWTSQGNLEDDMKKLGTYDTYKAKLVQIQYFYDKIQKIPVSENNCGPDYPYGCPEGKVCKEEYYEGDFIRGGGMNVRMTSHKSLSYVCVDPDVKDKKNSLIGNITYSDAGDGPKNNVHQVTSTASIIGTQTIRDENNNLQIKTTIGASNIGIVTYEDEGFDEGLSGFKNSNYCNIEELKKDYTSTCYSCKIVAIIIKTFMNAVGNTYSVTREAGIKLLAIGMMLWLAFYVFGKVSSFVSLEPMQMLQDLFRFFFKCLVAYVLITSGLRILIDLMVGPILKAGADYGIGIIDALTHSQFKGDTYNLIPMGSDKVALMDRTIFDKIMQISSRADHAVSINFVIADALMCHSLHAGAIRFEVDLSEVTKIPFYFPDVWLWLCGAAIWFFAFMVTMAVNFYLLDLSFKIGFAILALPVMIGLWPFKKFKDKFSVCVNIIINAAGTFMFLGITTGISVTLIDACLQGGSEKLFEAINNDNAAYVSSRFSLTGGAFFMLIFGFLYSHKLISETVSKMADKFFPAVTSGLSPMHSHTTQAIDFAKKQIGNAISAVGAVVTGGTTAAMKTAGRKMARAAIDKARGK